MENHNNPLKGYFRKPGIWIKLPSNGQYYSIKPKELNDMGEIPVYPMTAKDELLLKNADALLNGSAIKQIIKSCAPCIDDPELMPSIDLDAVLLGIRRCTYGEKMEVESFHDCGDNVKNTAVLDLNYFIGAISSLDKIDPVTLENGIKTFVKPVTVNQLLHLNWIQYEQIRNLQIADQQDLDEKTRVDLLQKSYEALTHENINIVSKCIDTVVLPDGVTVTDAAMIYEWVADLSKNDFKTIETAIMGLAEKGVNKSFKIKCHKCDQEYESQLDLNPTTFFA